MNQLERVEKIREKTGVSYEEAKEALDAAGGDVLDAIVYLENQGKIKTPEKQVYTTKQEQDTSKEFIEAAKTYQGEDQESFGYIVKKFLKWCGRIIKKGCENFFIVKKQDEEILSVPVIVLVLLLFAFWILLPLLVLGLFCGFRYSFKGNITKSVNVNGACDKAAQVCESMKKEFKN